MRTLILAVGFLISFGTAQAQYESLVETKLEHLSFLRLTVESNADLSEVDRAWALKHLDESEILLLEADQSNLEALQTAEAQINQNCQKITGRLMMTKHMKLRKKITEVETMIAQYNAEGLDTEPLETLLEAMKLHLKSLGL